MVIELPCSHFGAIAKRDRLSVRDQGQPNDAGLSAFVNLGLGLSLSPLYGPELPS